MCYLILVSCFDFGLNFGMKKTHGLEVSWDHFFQEWKHAFLRLIGLNLNLKYFYVGIFSLIKVCFS
jgi:hypothetical protein